MILLCVIGCIGIPFEGAKSLLNARAGHSSEMVGIIGMLLLRAHPGESVLTRSCCQRVQEVRILAEAVTVATDHLDQMVSTFILLLPFINAVERRGCLELL